MGYFADYIHNVGHWPDGINIVTENDIKEFCCVHGVEWSGEP